MLSLEPSCFFLAVDIGSTVVKLAQFDKDRRLLKQEFVNRKYDLLVAEHLKDILSPALQSLPADQVYICSSANGGLRIGIICLSLDYSGGVLRNQALLSGANPLYIRDMSEPASEPAYVDVLVVGGGIDCRDAGPLQSLLDNLSVEACNFGTLAYAGNRFCAERFLARFPTATVVENPMADGLEGSNSSVFTALRDAYLNDLVYKEGISEIQALLPATIRPTPEVVNKGYYRSICGESQLQLAGAAILIDVGGATTDLHYTVETIREDSSQLPPFGASAARYVFTDLGVAASSPNVLMQLRRHDQSYEMLRLAGCQNVNETYRLLREGDYEPTPVVLAITCLFLALERFAHGRGPGLPTADFTKVSHLVVTGGAAQLLEDEHLRRVAEYFFPAPLHADFTMRDTSYLVWTLGVLNN